MQTPGRVVVPLRCGSVGVLHAKCSIESIERARSFDVEKVPSNVRWIEQRGASRFRKYQPDDLLPSHAAKIESRSKVHTASTVIRHRGSVDKSRKMRSLLVGAENFRNGFGRSRTRSCGFTAGYLGVRSTRRASFRAQIAPLARAPPPSCYSCVYLGLPANREW